MKNVVGNLWTYPADYRVITTNGSRRKDGYAVMGRGCAKEATAKFPNLQYELGEQLRAHGNRVFLFEQYRLFTFPVKSDWMSDARYDLITASVRQLLEWLKAPQETIVMPRPGCGNGGLLWKNVEPLLQELPDNVHVIHFGRE